MSSSSHELQEIKEVTDAKKELLQLNGGDDADDADGDDGYDETVVNVFSKGRTKLTKGDKNVLNIMAERNVKDRYDSKVQAIEMEKMVLKVARQEVKPEDVVVEDGNWDSEAELLQINMAKSTLEKNLTEKVYKKEDIPTLFFNICFYCRQKGHLKKNCPRLKKCLNCNLQGVTIVTCPRCNVK